MGFVCPLGIMIMYDPVRASDGQVYERVFIEEIVTRTGGKNISPLTRQHLTQELIPDLKLKKRIQAFLAKFPDHPLNPS
ncbi:MAG: hypothetical protein EZS28_042952 [Streblomastix strix]|uniref:U-box domain-containing protein n=1 Tax=Streblomastix strix TaxID=222440 RepID=A0A5J4TU98_9EUKA|nr:MAG: hypothetical protein EZS28_042952 [Streblomastix strix]